MIITNLVLQSFGRESEYRRAILTVLSYYAYSSLNINQTAVYLFTDRPEYFKPFFSGLPINYILLTPEKIRDMRGEIDFLHRMKISLIDEAFGLMEGNMLYADSDTFFIADPTPLVKKASPKASFMHLREYEYESLRNMPLPAGESFQAFLKLIESRKFKLANGNAISVTPKHASWNAGVMIFHPAHHRLIPDVYALTNQFYPESRNHASEQYAFSVIMEENTVIKPCDSVIYHYWYRIKKQIVDQFLEDQLTKSWANKSFSEKLSAVKRWVDLLPTHFENHEWSLQDHAIQAFNENRFSDGYKWAYRAIKRKPFDTDFLKDFLYHFKRHYKK